MREVTISIEEEQFYKIEDNALKMRSIADILHYSEPKELLKESIRGFALAIEHLSGEIHMVTQIALKQNEPASLAGFLDEHRGK